MMRPGAPLPSRTALRVARGILALETDRVGAARTLLPEGTAPTLRALLAGAGVMSEAALARPISPARQRVEARLFPGAALHFALRKAWVDATVAEALATGAVQVLVVGAGFDPLSVRLAPQWPGATFVEVDLPETSAAKARGIVAAGLVTPNLHLVGQNLRDTTLASALPAGWQRDAPSVVVAEGVLMYLDEAAVGALLRGVAEVTAEGSTFAFTYLAARDDGRHPVPAPVRWVLSAVGEPLRWVVARAALGVFLARHGHRLAAEPDQAELRARFLARSGLADAPLDGREGFAVSRTAG